MDTRRKADKGLTVVGVSRDFKQAYMSDGAVIPITNLYDENGDDTDTWDDAVVFVAGADGYGWIAAPAFDAKRPVAH